MLSVGCSKLAEDRRWRVVTCRVMQRFTGFSFCNVGMSVLHCYLRTKYISPRHPT